MRPKLIPALIVAYALIGVASFGHCYVKRPAYFRGNYESTFTANKAFLAGMLWPLYWSVEAWRATA